jgi:hypothetical protein
MLISKLEQDMKKEENTKQEKHEIQAPLGELNRRLNNKTRCKTDERLDRLLQSQEDGRRRLGEQVNNVSEQHTTYQRLYKLDKAIKGGSKILDKLNLNKQQINDARAHARERDIVYHNNTIQVANSMIKINKAKKDRKE